MWSLFFFFLIWLCSIREQSSLTRDHPLHWKLGVLTTGPPGKCQLKLLSKPLAITPSLFYRKEKQLRVQSTYSKSCKSKQSLYSKSKTRKEVLGTHGNRSSGKTTPKKLHRPFQYVHAWPALQFQHGSSPTLGPC